MLLSIPVLWIWHLYYGTKKDAFTAAKLFSQVGVVVFVILFMVWDRAAVEEEAEHKALGNQKRNENVEFNKLGARGVSKDPSSYMSFDETSGLLTVPTTSKKMRASVTANGTSISTPKNTAKKRDPVSTAQDLVDSDNSSAPPHSSDEDDNERVLRRSE